MLCLAACWLSTGAGGNAWAQDTPPPPLNFLGLEPGLDRAGLEGRIKELGGTVSCRTSRIDPRIADCRGRLRDPLGTAAIEVTVSLVRDSSAVLLLSGPIGVDGAGVWLRHLTERFGPVASRQRGGQTSWEWVRRGRMIRLTSRREGGRLVASLSLVHGPLLDSLGKSTPGG